MGAILHPLFQNKKRMISSSICTESQFKAGHHDELLRRTARMLETADQSAPIV